MINTAANELRTTPVCTDENASVAADKNGRVINGRIAIAAAASKTQ